MRSAPDGRNSFQTFGAAGSGRGCQEAVVRPYVDGRRHDRHVLRTTMREPYIDRGVDVTSILSAWAALPIARSPSATPARSPSMRFWLSFALPTR